MFVQVMEGRVKDVEGLRAQVERWRAEVAPGARGFLGTTAGTTADGNFIALVRFESEEAARANSDRPEQGEWWAATSALYDGEVTFTDCPEVDTFGAGGADDAGFVQVMKGRADRSALQEVARESEAIMQRTRPDVIGGVVAWPGDGTFIQTVYFTSEAEARANETREPATDEERQAWERMGAAMQVDTYIDIADPWLFSA
ncbi:MAG TPA: hypothetical protein VM388_00895 [Acidimicrobiales bacterium]|nr:hypothetical protein [Acidimicrobiales bacterium]